MPRLPPHVASRGAPEAGRRLPRVGNHEVLNVPARCAASSSNRRTGEMRSPRNVERDDDRVHAHDFHLRAEACEPPRRNVERDDDRAGARADQNSGTFAPGAPAP